MSSKLNSLEKAKKFMILNIASNILGVLSNSLVAIWMTPFLIKNLGLAVFGMVPLVTSISNYLSIFNLTISGAVGRFVALHLGRNEDEMGNIYFNSSIFGLIGIGLLIAVPAAMAIWFLPAPIRIPEGYETDFSILLLLAILGSFAGAVTSSFQVSTFVTHRFFVFNCAKIASRILQVLLVVLLFWLIGPSLAMVGVGLLGMVVFLLGALIVISRRLVPQLRVHPKYFRWTALREMGGMGSWMVVDQIGSLLYFSTDLILINLFLGPTEGGRYAPVLQIALLLRVLAPAVAGVFAPIAIEFIARNEIRKLAVHTQTAIKFMGLLLALPTGLICGFAGPFLALWLGPDFADQAYLIWILLLPHVLFLATSPLYNINRGMNKVRAPALATVAGGVINIGLAVVFIQGLQMGLAGMALASILSFALRNVFFLPVYTARCLDMPVGHFFRSMPLSALAAGGIFLSGLLFQQFYVIHGFGQLVVACSLISLVYCACAYFRLLKAEDRELVLSLIGKRKTARAGA